MERKELYVDADQGQGFAKISEALEAAGQFKDMEVVIHIAPGTYRERLEIRQNHISFIGTDAKQTKITYSDGALDIMPEGDKRGTFRTQSVFIDADYFYARHISFCNEAGQGNKAGQALAVYADGDHLIFAKFHGNLLSLQSVFHFFRYFIVAAPQKYQHQQQTYIVAMVNHPHIPPDWKQKLAPRNAEQAVTDNRADHWIARMSQPF